MACVALPPSVGATELVGGMLGYHRDPLLRRLGPGRRGPGRQVRIIWINHDAPRSDDLLGFRRFRTRWRGNAVKEERQDAVPRPLGVRHVEQDNQQEQPNGQHTAAPPPGGRGRFALWLQEIRSCVFCHGATAPFAQIQTSFPLPSSKQGGSPAVSLPNLQPTGQGSQTLTE